MNQPKLFEQSTESVALEDVLLYALGEFQSRGHKLADRELALDRLHGAFVRAFEKFGVPAVPDEGLAQGLRSLGANVVEIPNYVAKRPYRITVSNDLANNSAAFYLNESSK